MIFNKQNHTAFFLNGLDNSKRANPQGIFHLVSAGGREFVKNLYPGVGHLSILLDTVIIVPFQHQFHFNHFATQNKLQ